MKSCLPSSALFLGLAFLFSPPHSLAQTEQDTAPRPLPDENTTKPTQSAPSAACGPAGCIVSHDEPLDTASRQPGQARSADGQQTRRTGLSAEDRDMRVDERAGKVSPPTLEPPTDFEAFVHDTTGVDAPIFGQRLFLNTPDDFVPATSLSAPADYLIGPGDQLKIRTWGNVQMDVSATVDRNGQVFIPQAGTLDVAGKRMDEMQAALHAAIGRQFRNFDLSVTLGQLRSIQVFVLGHARRPGVYTVSSLSTLVNALFASGGPSNSGSLRDVQLKRDGTAITHFDVYDLLNGDKNKDVHLLPGDVIDIPLVGPQVAVVGDVTQPAIYELKGATSAADALQLAGGLTAVATVRRASLDRIADHSHRTIQDFPLNGSERLIPVQGGDVLRVFPISPRIENAVTLRGYVGDPGRYPWHAGMHISDLIPSRQFLLTRNYYNKQNALNKFNTDHPFAESSNGPESTSTVHALTGAQREAAANTPEVLAQNSQTDLATHETEINWNYASIERLGEPDLTTHVLSFALGEAVDHPDSPENKLLEPGDVIVVYSVRDINLPTELRARFVRIDGEVSKPGIYRIEDDQTLRDLVNRAGGLAPHAYPYAAQLNRESVRLAEEIKLRGLLERETQEVLSPVNSPSSPEAHGSAGDLELRRAYLQALQQVRPTGRVVLQVSPTIRSAAELPPFPLQDGDHFFVPAVPSTVEVLGNVFNQGSLRHVDGRRVGDYLNAAGGHTREADKARDFVLRADGTVLSREKVAHFDKLVLYPGDAVVIPGRFKPGFNLYDTLAIAQLTTNLAIAAAAVSALH